MPSNRSGAAAVSRALAVGIGFSFAAASCFLSGFERVEGGPVGGAGGEATGGTGGGGGGGAGGGAVCDRATVPDPPSAPDAGGDLDFVVALRSIDLGEAASAPALGLDLDAKCTCDTDGASCQSAVEHCDAPGGVDNSAKTLFALLATLLSEVSSSAFSQNAEEGKWTVLLRIRGYTGEASDSKVRVDWYLAGTFTDALGMPAQPLWDGSDAWPISSTSFGALPLDPASSQYFDANAYVIDGTLVAALPSTELRFAGTVASMRVRITGGVLLASVVPVNDGTDSLFRLEDGLFAGRWREPDMFQSIGSYRDEAGQGICTGDLGYAVAKNEFCNARDIPTALSGTPGQPCDAVSLSFGFEASPARLGAIYMAPAEVPYCVAPEGDPSVDSCAAP